MRILIIGCGYIGSALGQKLISQGHKVIGVVQSEKSALVIRNLGIEPCIADCTTKEGTEQACQEGADVVIFSMSSKGGDYRKTYVDGMRYILAALQNNPPHTFFYTSSTSVYAQTDGQWVTESSPTEPLHESGKLLLETEKLLREAARERFRAFILRLSGIYGPGRHALLDKLRTGIETLPGDGNYWVNQIHRDDVVEAIHFLMKLEARNSKLEIFNVSDNSPILHHEYAAWLCQKLGRPLPRYLGGENISHRRGKEASQPDRRISNHALCELGWKPRYPSYQKGFLSLLK